MKKLLHIFALVLGLTLIHLPVANAQTVDPTDQITNYYETIDTSMPQGNSIVPLIDNYSKIQKQTRNTADTDDPWFIVYFALRKEYVVDDYGEYSYGYRKCCGYNSLSVPELAKHADPWQIKTYMRV